MLHGMVSRFSLERAKRAQELLALKVRDYDDFESPIKFVGGADVAWRGELAVGCITIHEFPSLKIVEKGVATIKSSFPYIPTLLSFREVKPLMAAIAKITTRPSILFVNGQGRAHPRGLGLASHLGVVADIPTIGVAQSTLYGKPKSDLGSVGFVELIDEVDDKKVIGYLYRSDKRFKAICISVGHRVSLDTALKLTMLCTWKGIKLPVPLRSAHVEASKEVKSLDADKV